MHMASIKKGRTRFGQLVGKLAEEISIYLQIALLVLVLVFIVAWTFPPAREYLERKKWFDEHTMNEAVALALLMTMGLLNHLYRKMAEVSREVQHLVGMGSNMVLGGVGQVYPHLRGAIEKIGGGRSRSLEVLGLTLYTAWPQIQAWISEAFVRDLEITLYCLDPEFIRNQNMWIPGHWENNSRAQIESVRRFRAENAEDLKARSISLELILYSSFPAIHGFRLGSGELFLSFSWWSGEIGRRRLSDPNHFYERFRAEDRSARAEEYRKLFENWIKEAGIRTSGNPRSLPKGPQTAPHTGR